MPFTLAHAAIAYPLKKIDRRLSVSGLIAGAIIPDFEYFIRMRHISSGHQLNERLLLDVLAAVLLCFIFHGLIKKPLYDNLPEKYTRFIIPAMQLNWNRHTARQGGLILVSVILGIFSHLLWDSFTHKGGLMTELISPLRYTVTINAIQFPVYFILQLLSSIAGLWILYRMIPAPATVTTIRPNLHKNSFYWPRLILVSVCLFLLRYFYWAADNSYLSLLKALIGSFLYSWIIISLLCRLTVKK